MSTVTAIPAGKQLCTFLVNGLLFGIDVNQVQEVVQDQEMTPVPLAPAAVKGLINLRGHIVSAIEMRERLGMERRADGALPMNVIVRGGDGIVSLLVDEIGDVVNVAGTAYENPPPALEAGIKEFIDGVYKLDRQLLLLLNTKLAMQIDVSGPVEETDAQAGIRQE